MKLVPKVVEALYLQLDTETAFDDIRTWAEEKGYDVSIILVPNKHVSQDYGFYKPIIIYRRDGLSGTVHLKNKNYLVLTEIGHFQVWKEEIINALFSCEETVPS